MKDNGIVFDFIGKINFIKVYFTHEQTRKDSEKGNGWG
jgi:hypothetical protein